MSLDPVEKGFALLFAACGFAMAVVIGLGLIALAAYLGWWLIVAVPFAVLGVRLCYRIVSRAMDDA